MLLRTKWHRYRAKISALGVRASIKFALHPIFGMGPTAESTIHPRQVRHPLRVRWRSSDVDVFRQVFIRRVYAGLEDMTDVGLVIDCGANVGYSSAYFLSRFPTCQVIAVEPDPDNFAVLRRNMAPYGERVTSIRAAVWSHSAGLVISREAYRDGRHWTRQVRPCRPDETPEVEGMDIASILAASGHDRISILKVDVEGAEVVMFGENFTPWLDKVDAIAIELHDDSSFGTASDVFYSAISGQGFQVSRHEPLTICRRSGANSRGA